MPTRPRLVGGGSRPMRLVFADCADGHVGVPSELVDGHALQLAVGVGHGLDSNSKYRYGKYCDDCVDRFTRGSTPAGPATGRPGHRRWLTPRRLEAVGRVLGGAGVVPLGGSTRGLVGTAGGPRDAGCGYRREGDGLPGGGRRAGFPDSRCPRVRQAPTRGWAGRSWSWTHAAGAPPLAGLDRGFGDRPRGAVAGPSAAGDAGRCPGPTPPARSGAGARVV